MVKVKNGTIRRVILWQTLSAVMLVPGKLIFYDEICSDPIMAEYFQVMQCVLAGRQGIHRILGITELVIKLLKILYAPRRLLSLCTHTRTH